MPYRPGGRHSNATGRRDEAVAPAWPRSVVVPVYLPKVIVEEALKVGLNVVEITRRALQVYVNYNLPPMVVPEGVKVRVDVSIPVRLARELKERGGVKPAAWFVAKIIEAITIVRRNQRRNRSPGYIV